MRLEVSGWVVFLVSGCLGGWLGMSDSAWVSKWLD